VKDDDHRRAEFGGQTTDELDECFHASSRCADDDDRRLRGLDGAVHDGKFLGQTYHRGRAIPSLRYNPLMGTDAALVERFLDAFARRDGDALAAMVADDFVFEPLSTEAAERDPYRGSDGMRSYLRDVAATWRQFDLSVGAVEEVDGHVLVTGRIYARARESSLVADDPVAFAWKVVNGRARWGKVFLSESAARRAIHAT
jgi:ketosteroid isomerase-like protein